jgi:hypothetical protein
MMARRTHHVYQSVRGALLNWGPKEYRNVRADDGTPMTMREVKAALLDHLAQGHEVIPIGPACEGFDYKTGCPGHDIPDEGGEGAETP